MNEAQRKALLEVLEHQRNAAMNGLANVEAALKVALAENQTLKSQINQLSLKGKDTDVTSPAEQPAA